jgi:hypothetical protein
VEVVESFVPSVEEVVGVLDVEEAVGGETDLALETIRHHHVFHRIAALLGPLPLVPVVCAPTSEVLCENKRPRDTTQAPEREGRAASVT